MRRPAVVPSVVRTGRVRTARAVLAAVLVALLSLAALLALPLATAGPAQAVGYRYWSFWQLDNGDGGAGGGRWTYATQGPSVVRPSDGDVEGFRFSVSQGTADSAQPRGGHDFAAICGHTPAGQDSKRIALVIDPGTTADAPAGEHPPAARTACAKVPADATSADALAAVAKPLRYDGNALLCAIAGYPQTGCGEQVQGTRPAAGGAGQDTDADDDSSGHHIPSAGIITGVVAVALLGVAAVWQARRRHR